MRILTFKKVYLIHGKQRLEWLWVFQPWFGKNKTVIGTFWTSEHLRGHWKCSKVFLSIQSKKKNLKVKVKGDWVFDAICCKYVCYDQSAKVYSLSLIFSTLCVVHDLIFQLKLSRSRLPIAFVDHAGMKNISAEVSIFCLWTNWIHLVTCIKIEFRELYCCSRCALDKIFKIYTFDRCPQGWSGQKSFLTCGDAKKENWRTTKLFLKHVP